MNRTVSNWLAVVAGTIVALAASYGAYQLANYAWAQVVDYRSPYPVADIPETTATVPPEVRAGAPTRVVYVIVDGLREDVSRKMPTLNSLRDRGFDAVVRNDQPSLSFPTWTTLLSGAPQRISGVTTNWFEGRVPVETLFDVAFRQGAVVAVAAPTDFEALYRVKRSPNVVLKDWEKGSYLTGDLVDSAISLARESSATLVVMHSPDIDEAGHYEGGGASKAYLDTAKRVDLDIGRLVTALQDDRTVFVIAADHGHIATGGHGGWETEVTRVPAVFAGSLIKIGAGEGTQDQVAPTIALLMGLPAPRHATGTPLAVVDMAKVDTQRFDEQQIAAYDAYTATVTGQAAGPSATAAAARAGFVTATEDRLAAERRARLPVSAALALAAVAVLAVIGVLSWRALASAMAGTAAYYAIYNALFFLVHGYRWSLSAFNAEDYLKAFFNGRMIEAVIAGALGAAVAAEVYLSLRADPKRPHGEYLPGWLALGTSVALAIQATLLLQIAWYLWRWGVNVTWVLPDFGQAFKADLDMIQGTAIAGVALLGPLVTWFFGRVHPFRTGTPAPEREDAA